LRFPALWRILPRTAKKPKSPQFVARKIVITSHPKSPWRVSFPVEENGVTRRKRRMFSTEEKALAFAIGHEKEVADHGVRFGGSLPRPAALSTSTATPGPSYSPTRSKFQVSRKWCALPSPGSAAGKMNTLKIARPAGKNKKDRN
jgi:hypothetical protein